MCDEVCYPPEKGDNVCYQTLKYIQPKVPTSYKPVLRYEPPKEPFERCTVYKLSYLPELCSRKVHPVIPGENLMLSGKFSTVTTQKHDFIGYPVAKPPAPIRYRDNEFIKHGSVYLNISTQKHDYVSKPVPKRETYYPQESLVHSPMPLEDLTTMNLSYLPPGPCVQRTYGFRPRTVYKPPDVRGDFTTINRASYLPVCLPPKEQYPWIPKRSPAISDCPFSSCTVYRTSYIPPGALVGPCNPCQPCAMPAECSVPTPCCNPC